jgi:2-polyprenyl-6-methoxyphenol hydroxylase-like FAD-dependent oxidoreductase
MGRVDRHHLSSHVSRFCDFLEDRGKVVGKRHKKFHGHAYQLYERVPPTLVGDGVLLVGDAAGLAYPQSGEGIRPAVESGLIAADVIMSCGGRYSRDDLDIYARRIGDRFGRPRGPGVTQWLPTSWRQGLAARLLASPWFARRIVMERWFLHTKDPALTLRHGPQLTIQIPDRYDTRVV